MTGINRDRSGSGGGETRANLALPLAPWLSTVPLAPAPDCTRDRGQFTGSDVRRQLTS